MYIRINTWIRQMEEAQRKKNIGKVDIVSALVSASSDVHANVNEFFE